MTYRYSHQITSTGPLSSYTTLRRGQTHAARAFRSLAFRQEKERTAGEVGGRSPWRRRGSSALAHTHIYIYICICMVIYIYSSVFCRNM